MSRCKACDSILKDNEIIWREEIQQLEDLCVRCRQEVFELSEEDIETLDMLNETDLEEH